jgi:hypothetical protein
MAAKTAPPPPKHELDEEANDRIADARLQKMPFELDMRECYFFTDPLRTRQVNSLSLPPQVPLHDDGFLQTSTGYEVTEDFVNEAINTFMPQNENWSERAAGMFAKTLPDAVLQEIREGDNTIFKAIKGCNFYSELGKAAYPDLAIGTMALWITDPGAARNIQCLATPLRELEINLGPDGMVDDRFAVRFTKNRYVRKLLGGSIYDKIPADLKEEIEAAPTKPSEVRWGYWRLWDEVGDETWRHVAMIKNRVVHSARLVGEGSCPLVVTRFGATCDWAFALGRLLRALPELRQIDELEGQKVAHIELNLTPPMAFPDDSFAAIEQGLEPGEGYPVRVGSENAIKKIYDPGPPEQGVYLIDDKIKRLRKMFYVDYPEQRGDTPPTLGQWMDELARAQRRIGFAGMSFWLEGPAQYFLRFKYLLEKRGVLNPVKVNGNLVALHPVNPAQRAAEQQDIAMAVRFIQIAGQAWPEEFKAYIDGRASMIALLQKMRVTLLKIRPQKDVDAAIKQIAPLISAHLGAKVSPGEAQNATALQ